MATRPDFAKIWAGSRLSIPEIAGGSYAAGWDTYLGPLPPLADDHDYVMNLQDTRASWLKDQALAAVGHEWQSDIAYSIEAYTRSQVNGKLYKSLEAANTGNEPSVSPAEWREVPDLSAPQVQLLDTVRIDVASASTVNLTTAAPNTSHINITGTTTINGFTAAAGVTYFVRFNAALTLTNGAGLVTQTVANILTAAGDTCIIRATAANVVEVLSYVRGITQAIGEGQTWQDVTSSRSSGTTYTNTTNKPIQVLFRLNSASSSTVAFNVAGSAIPSTSASGGGVCVAFIVPSGATYSITYTNALSVVWAELR